MLSLGGVEMSLYVAVLTDTGQYPSVGFGRRVDVDLGLFVK